MRRPSFHETLEREQAIEGPTDRRFGLTVGGILLLLGALLLWRGHSSGWFWTSGAAALLIAAAAAPRVLAPLNRAWLRLGLVLFAVLNPVVMAILYCVAIVPTGLLLRLLGKDPLRLKRKPKASTYWIARPAGPAQRDGMRNQF